MRHPYLYEIIKQIYNSFSSHDSEHIWIYGSQANDTAKPDSDIDLIVFDDPDNPNDRKLLYDVFSISQKLSQQFSVEINPQRCTYDCFQHSHLTFWRTVRKEAFPISQLISCYDKLTCI